MSFPSPDREFSMETSRSIPSRLESTRLDRVLERFAVAWRKGEQPRVEDYLNGAGVAARPVLLLKLLGEELALRGNSGETVSPDDYHSRFPSDRQTVDQAFQLVRDRYATDVEFERSRSFEKTFQYATLAPAATVAETPVPHVRYRKIRELGSGAFGTVWLADDLELRRQVALKEPRHDRLRAAADIETYLTEARALASLDHPRIVPVYDVGRTTEGGCYIVSKWIDGMNLAAYVKQKPLSFAESAELVAQVADALEQTHNRGLVHRDIKPTNILVDGHGQPYVADFGLALRDEDFGAEKGIAGTPAYMSPEQARREGHRIDGRSDIYSLGVVFYELLTGTRPFQSEDVFELLERIKRDEPKPPRQRNDAIPKELERICLKALSKRAADRYSCAADLAADLRHWIKPSDAGRRADATPSKIVPKGLRSFDAADSDFFLGLLPGPRDRDELPESLRFWKTRIEETDPDKTFRVGLVYGPSGCGKSSLMKAGLLPRLADHVVRVFVEATPDETEKQLLQGLLRACGDLPREGALVESMERVRRGKGLTPGRKVLLVLDQFEQWLFAHGAEEQPELVVALRQCDGERIQALILVRDDFYRDANRLMRQLETPLREGRNQALVDVFDPRHARGVLAEFGKAYGQLPENLGQLSEPQETFLTQAVSGLAQDGKVICVRLALFAEMMKGRDWTPETLREVGGAEGIGTTFLEETFSAKSAPAWRRQHQEAARAVLRALLPDVGTEIKGRLLSVAELREASGHADRPQEFAELIRVLDSETRLITPVTGEGQEPGYQLTHDYLVPSLRDWLTRKQRETRRGRAELRLEERSATWNPIPENRYLPSLGEFLRIRALTEGRRWTEPERRMMARASRFHGARSALATAAFAALLAIGLFIRANVVRQREATRVEGLVDRLVSAEPSEIPEIVSELEANPALSRTILSPLSENPAENLEEKRAQLHARMASVAYDRSWVQPLKDELLGGKLTYVLPIRRLLRPYAAELVEEFRGLLRDEKADSQHRFRAALALAEYLPPMASDSWTAPDLKFVSQRLVSANAESQPSLREALRPIRERLLPDLERIFADSQAPDVERMAACNVFLDYAANDIPRFSRLLTVATPEQFAVLYPLVAASASPAIIEELGVRAATLPSEDLGSVGRVSFGQRRANAAVTLLRLNEGEKALSVFEMTDDPEALTQFIFRLRPREVGVEAILDLLRLVTEAPPKRYPSHVRYALLLSLGEFTLAEIPDARRESLVRQVAEWYGTDPSSGVHGAAGWLLRKWGQAEAASKVDQAPAPYSPDREWFTLAIDLKVGSESPSGDVVVPTTKKTFYFTFVVFQAGEFTVGSEADEPDRQENEVLHKVTLTRPFAILDREVTMEELIANSPYFSRFMKTCDGHPADAGMGASWYDAVAFCRWLGEQSGLTESDQAYAAPESFDEKEYPREPAPAAKWAPRDWPLDLDHRGFRLPTESEWEVAARAGARTAYGHGGDAGLLGRFGWFAENNENHGHPPRESRPSRRGLFDLGGNVWEWTHDWMGDFSAEAVTDPLGPRTGSYRVLRGGGLGEDAAHCRTAFRATRIPSIRFSAYGFRLAVSLTGSASPVEPE